ncbi:hypothetical protein [Rhizobium leguminosarum]|uniref:hypothetical protein n=1 Tax=Rhizobium leguminosarum TaxID=384 RepID=UPI0015DB2554|nr:hypothetical protein [Rhizobium leguminosarum]NZD53141.1 hypothetical protein [Rhizobium leguminosarum]
MLGLATTRIRPLTEDSFNEIVELAGGKRAHPDQDRRAARNADYILGDAVIELKILDDEGLSKAERQTKLAALFTALDPDKPVRVLDRELLDLAGQRAYDRAMEGPIKGAVKSAKGQLVQSRSEFPETKRSILMLINNANTALDHDEIVQMVGRRARNDTDDVDGVVVAGAYLHSDGFDTFALWPIDYVPISLDQPFPEYEALRDAFHGYAERSMTGAIINGLSADLTKGPILDTGFKFDGKMFVKPAPPLGKSSDFYINGRPRLNSTGIETSPIVGLTFPEFDRNEWAKFRAYMPEDDSLGERFEDWVAEREEAISRGTLLKPLVPIAVTFDAWISSLNGGAASRHFKPVRDYANRLYQRAITNVIDGARDLEKTKVIPSRYVLAVTELIGQDQANDVSHIFLVEEHPGGGPLITALVRNAQIFHLHACTLGASYAVKHGVTSLRWKKVMTYAWS